ncbi:MAG: hypothetical protein L3K18_03450 [Thermoplasmata archaeon]|nr:hypothetical protein [Thermoplasmata archaeon]MCI4356188.1 hypothetical protein [Thermoplasmata archaeon]
MRGELAALVLFGLGGVAAFLAVAATANPGLEVELAVSGVALASIAGVLVLSPSVRPRYAPAPQVIGSTLVLLRDSFRSGPLGRQAIVAAVVSLEHRRDPSAAVGMNPDEERRIMTLDAVRFRSWLDERLDRLERET